MIPTPPPLESLPYGTRLVAGMSHSTIVAEGDFETYSPAGFVWNPHLNKWGALPGAAQNKKGLSVVGATVYTEHPDAEVLVFKYDLKDGRGRREWRPGMPNPTDLFAFLAAGGLFEAWNAGFEVLVWQNICMPKHGWPPLPLEQVRCAMAKARAHALPGGLELAGRVLNLRTQKDADGKRLLQKFSIPRNPTKHDPRTRHRPTDPDCLADGQKLYSYCDTDIATEAEASSRVPDLCEHELPMWQMDQRINRRGVAVDTIAIENCIAVIEQAYAKYNAELYVLTGGAVAKASELPKLTAWLARFGVATASLDEEHLDALLARKDIPGPAYRALQIRAAVGSAAVKKLYAMRNTTARDGRIHNLFNYHAARTGRTTGDGAQPTNFPNSGPDVYRCGCCKHYFGVLRAHCPWCGVPLPPTLKTLVDGWGPEAVEDALAVIAGRSLDLVEWFFGNALAVVSGCLRGLFIAPPGRDLLCSDYSSIEAVVLAEIAGEEWRREVFRTHGKIYEMSAAKIAGVPFEDFMRHAGYTDEELAAPDWYKRKPKTPGSHHPLRKTIGKVAELASGYQGWINSWIAFGADAFMNEDEMKRAILAWRDASPAIVEFWGGQFRKTYVGWVPEMYGVEGMFVSAILNPGKTFEFRGFQFTMRGDAVYLRLLSGRYLTYHRPRLTPSDRFNGGLSISFEGYNTNPKNGPIGWIRMSTWGGRLTENIVQATARDIQWHGMRNLEAAGYDIVLHVYDEDIAEVPEGFGSVQEFEAIMSTMPAWARDWPIRANGGWRRKRYGK